jgi:LPXTG-motif cell wall-anchored protein
MTVIEAAPPSPGTRANDLPAPDQPNPASPPADRTTAGGPAAPGPDRPPALPRRGQLVALAVGTFLLPWCVLLGLTLPATAEAQHWSLAWAGLDCAEALAALATAALLRRADPRAGLTAVAGGTLLLVDAWFDVCTSAPGLDHALAVAEACCLELPLAAAAFWLALLLTHGNQQHISSSAMTAKAPRPSGSNTMPPG